MLARQDVVELGHVVAPRAGDLDVRADRYVGPPRQVAIDRVGTLLAVAGRLDQRRRTGHEVAAGEHAAHVRRVGRRVDLDPAAVDLERRLDRQEGQVGRLRHGRDHGLGRDLELGTLDRDRRAATRGVGLAKPVSDEADGGDLPVLADDLDRAGQELHPDAFALGLAQLLLVDDELGAGPPVDDRDAVGAVAEAGPGAVPRGVAAADDDDVGTDGERLAEVGLLHEVDAVVDTLEVGAGDVEGHRVHRARGDRDAIVVALELVERDVHADLRVEHELHAESLDEADIHLDRLARQAECRHADEHRAATVREAVEDRDPVALHRQLTGDRQPGRPGADDRDPLVARRDLGHHVRDAGGLVPFDQEPLHGPDRERPVDVAAPAGPLAGCRADVRAHRRDRVGVAGQDVALLEPALRGQIQVAAAVRPHGAGFLAFDVALEPGRVHRLDEEFRGLVDDQAGVPFPDARRPVGDGRSEVAPTRGIYHRSHATCTVRCGAGRCRAGAGRRIGRMFDPELTMLMDAATLLDESSRPPGSLEPEMRAA